MRTFENFRKVINESDYILSEAQRYLEILLEKDSEALKQYKASKKSFQKGFGKNIKPTVVQPGLDLYKAGGPYVPDKTTFADTGKKVPKMEKKPQFGTPKTTNKTGAPDRTLVKKAIKDVKDSERRLFQKGLGKGTAGVKGVKGKKGISLARQRGYTKEIIKDLSAKTTQSDARIRGASTEGSAGASSSSKTVTPTKGVNQAEVSKKIAKGNEVYNQQRIAKTNKVQQSKLSQTAKDLQKQTEKIDAAKQKLRSATGTKDVKKIRQLNVQGREYRKLTQATKKAASGVGNPNAPVKYNKMTAGTAFIKKNRKSNTKVTQNLTTPPKGQEYNPRTITKTRKVKASIFNPPDYGTASYYKRQGKDAFDLSKNPITKKVSTSKGPQLPKFLNMRTGNINVRKTKGAVDYSKLSSANKSFARTASALVKKAPKALGIQKAASGIAKAGLKLGRYGRLGVAGGLISTALSPAGRRFIGTALAGGGLAYLANRKGPPKLKVGDGITKTTNLPSKFQPKNAKNLSYVDAYGKKRKLESGDVRFKFGLTGTKKNKDGTVTPGGMQYNKQDMARVKNIQKKYIDSYNASVKGNPFKKQIKYKVEKDGSYTVTPPKKK